VSLQRRTPLARGKALARSTRLAPVNRRRKAETYVRNFGERGDPIRAMTCLAQVAVERLNDSNALTRWVHSTSYCSGPFRCQPGLPSVVQAAHARARKMGGRGGDRRDLIPLCARHHLQAGEARTSQRADFERQYGIDLQVEAARIAAELDAKGIP
jgi:hypothetical protein